MPLPSYPQRWNSPSSNEEKAYIKESLEWHKQGLRLHTHRPFERGTELELGIQTSHFQQKYRGIVVDCHSCSASSTDYEVLLYWIDPPQNAFTQTNESLLVSYSKRRE